MAALVMRTEDNISAPLVVFALRRESMYFRRAYRFRTEKRGRDSFYLETSPDPFFMLETGVGAAAMETALRWCLSGPRFGGMPYRPRLLISAGFSGALQPELHIGDLVLATEVVDQQGNRWPTIRPAALSGCDISAGRLLTMPELVGDPQEKQRLGRQYEAVAVDLESAVAARLCHQHSVPFACVRVISDDWQSALSPHLVELLRRGRVSLPRLIAKVLRHPKLIGELWRLAGQTRHASRKLLGPLSAILSFSREP